MLRRSASFVGVINEARRLPSRSLNLAQGVGVATRIWRVLPQSAHAFAARFSSSSSASAPSSPPSSSSQPLTFTSTEQSDKPADSRLMIAFTCRRCGTRTTKSMSRHAYDHGVVIVLCPGCDARHLIADHLGWFSDRRVTIEDINREHGEEVRRFVKVGNQVLEWETLEEKKQANGTLEDREEASGEKCVNATEVEKRD